jgi:hypothetical protein
MHFEELMYTNICHANVGAEDVDDFIQAFQKVWEHLDELRDGH